MDAEARNQRIIAELTRSYWMEIETIINYLSCSINLDGVRAEEIKKSLAADVQGELLHAQAIALRIKTLGGIVPGSFDLKPEQKSLQPPEDTTDVVAVIRGVLDAEEGAIEQYKKIIALCDGFDYVTQDFCITTLADEETHRREFRGYLREYERGR
jgi:bacterioferritin